jgi:hypothetical protein
MTFADCPTWYLFYGFPTVFPLDGLVLWVWAGAISGKQLQRDICIDDIRLLSYLLFFLVFLQFHLMDWYFGFGQELLTWIQPRFLCRMINDVINFLFCLVFILWFFYSFSI